MSTSEKTPAKTRNRRPGKKVTAATDGAEKRESPPSAIPADPVTPVPMASVPLAVRWGDLDAFNHVNNAAFLVYAQEARLAWLAGIDGDWFDETMMPVVAAAQVNYRRQLAWPAQIRVELTARRVGNSSLTIAHRIVDAGDPACLYADGEVVMVWIHPDSGASVALPDAIRAACAGAA